MSDSGDHSHPHVALLPGAGMGHVTPCLRLAASLVHQNCQVSLITIRPIVSLAESNLVSLFLSAFPQVIEKQFHLLPLDPSTVNTDDPFELQWEATRRSVHILTSLLSSLSPPLSALVADVALISPGISVSASLNLPFYILFTSAARMFSLFAYYHTHLSKTGSGSSPSTEVVEIPGIGTPVPKSSLPPPLLVPDSFFASLVAGDGHKVTKLNGILINTFGRLESNSVTALKGGLVVEGLPPVFTVALLPSEFEKGGSETPLKWLDNQSVGTVLYVSFGSRTALQRGQIRELGQGLIQSGYPFLWVVKDKKLDKEENESLEEVLGAELMRKIKDKGLVVKEWVNQGEILGHKAVGGFLSHSGWNSVVEAAWNGVRLLAWPQGDDQRVTAEVVEGSGLGIWPKNFGWQGEKLVKGEEIGKRVKEMMENECLRLQAAEIREEARKAVAAGGSCDMELQALIEAWKKARTV